MRKVVIIIVLVCSLIFTGCWDKKELNELSLVTAVGLDRDMITKDIKNTSQVIRVEALQKGGGNSNVNPIELITTNGKTLLEARLKINKQFDRNPFYGHCRVVIIGEKLASEGIKPILDRLVRSYEMRPLTWILIAKDASPEELLSIKHGVSRIQGSYLNNIAKLSENLSESNVSTLQNFIEQLFSNESSPTTGVLKVVKNTIPEPKDKGISETRAITLSGTAMFKKDKLVGYLDDTETRGLNWILGNVKRSGIVLPSEKVEGKYYSAYTKNVKSSVNPRVSGDKYIFNIHVNLDAELSEQQDEVDTSSPGELEKIEGRIEELIQKEIISTMHKLQKELGVDAGGFGSALYKKYPSEWKKVKKEWSDIFYGVQYNIVVDARIVRTGLLQKPIIIEE